MENCKGAKDVAVRVANVIVEQLRATTAQNIMWSWGIHGWGAGWVFNDEEFYMPCLVLDVSGLMHKGRVVVALNDGLDTYEVALFDHHGKRVGDWHKDIYFDTLGKVLDELIEKPAGMSDEEYQTRSAVDSFIKWMQE